MGEHFDREIKIMRMVESMIVHNPEIETSLAVRRATTFVDLQQRRIDQADHKDWEVKLNEELRDK